jgi:hypothetical protein
MYLIEQEDLRTPDETAGEGDELPLALGQVLAAGLRREAREISHSLTRQFTGTRRRTLISE